MNTNTTPADKIWQPHEAEHLDISGKGIPVISQAPETSVRKAEISDGLTDEKPAIFPNSPSNQAKAIAQNGNEKIKKSIEELQELSENELKDRLANMSLLELEGCLDFIISKNEQTEGENYILFYAVQEIGNRGPSVFSKLDSYDEWVKAKDLIVKVGNYFLKQDEESEEIRGKMCETLGKISPALVKCINLKYVKKGKTSYPPLSTMEVLIVSVFYRTLQNGKETEFIHSRAIEAIKKICFSPVGNTNLILALLELQQSGEDEEMRNKAKTLLDNIAAIFKVALKDEDAEVKRIAIRSLGMFGAYGSSYTDDIVAKLIDTLGDASEEVINEAVAALVKIGPLALPRIVNITARYGGDALKPGGIKVLGAMGKQDYADKIKEEALTTLIGVIKNKYAPTDNKIAAAEAIVRWGNKAENVSVTDENENPSTIFNELKAAFLNTYDSGITSKIGLALFKLNSDRTLHFFRGVLAMSPGNEKDAARKDKIIKARRAATFLLGKAGEKAKSEYRIIISLLNDDDYTLRLCAVEALGSIGRYLSREQKQEVINALTNMRGNLEKRNKGWFVRDEEKNKNNKMISAINKALSRIKMGDKKPEPPELRPR